MRCNLPAGELRNALTAASHVTPATPSQPAYAGVLLTVTDDQLTALGYDGETSISATAVVTDSTPGQVLVPPRPMAAYLATLDPTLAVTLEAISDVEVSLTASTGAPYRFRRLPTVFPLPPLIKNPATAIDLSRLPAALAAVRTSVPKETPVVQLVSGSFGLRLHATDNYRLTRVELAEATLGAELTAVISLSVLERVARFAVDSVQVDSAGRSIRFAGPDTAITTRFLAMDFPNVDTIVERHLDHSCVLPVAELRIALSRLAAVAEASPLNVALAQSELTLSVENTDLGSGVEHLTLPSHLDAPFSFAAKLSYLSDALAGLGGSDVTMSWSSANEAVYLQATTPLPVTCIVMPMRL
jgi:DNA polymerase III sliding clamp (beta) subunit (PCNA family)